MQPARAEPSTPMNTASATPAPIAASDPATQLLLADHREMRALLERYRALGDDGAGAKERDDVGDELCELLIVHGTLEEEIFYPAAAAAGVDAELIDAEEHGRVRDGVARIRALSRDDVARIAALVAVAEAACRHA